jgi:alginate O-acetyltransferase complex protein AlgI
VLAIGKKFLLADPLLAWALPIYAHPEAQGAAFTWGAVYAYAFGLYLDFAAYSDFAIGVGAVAGVRLRENFDHPYLQPNLGALWQHWHMSLTSWLRDFVFVPTARRMLRLSARPLASQGVAQIVTMVACGLWHGLAWNYLVWGLYNGVLLTALAAYRARRGPAPASLLRRGVATLATFHAFALGLVVFANDLPRTLLVLRRLLGG